MAEILNNASSTLATSLEDFASKLLAGLLTSLLAILAAIVTGVVAYVQNSAKQLEQKTVQIALHRESNEYKKNTPRSSGSS